MKKLLIAIPFLFAGAVQATSLNPFAACGILNFNNTECAQYAAEQCGYTGDVNKADSGCLFRYGFRPKFQTGADHKRHFCGFSTTKSASTVWGDCSGSRG